MSPRLSIVIVSWNVRAYLRACLASIEATVRNVPYEVIVVDNASRDGSAEMVAAEHPRVRVVPNTANVGFAPACNQGLAIAQGEFVLFLNPDARLTEGCLETMIAAMERDPEVGLVGPLVTDESGAVVSACRRARYSLWEAFKSLFLIDEIGARLRVLAGSKIPLRYRRSGPAGCLQGACLLGRRQELVRLGGFDARVPLYLDDIDLCIRYVRQDRTLYYEPTAVVVHVGARAVHQLPNSRLASLVGYLAHDVYFLKHFGLGQVLAHHVMLFVGSTIFLLGDVILLPFLLPWRRAFILAYLQKHAWMWIYALTFRMRPRGYPEEWPRSLPAAIGGSDVAAATSCP